MKTSMTFKSIAMITLLGAALAVPVLAQPGPGMGGGMGGGMGPGMGGGMGSGMGGGMGMQNAGPGPGNMGPGMGPGGRGGRGMGFNQNNTRGWALMTPEERTAFQIKMREVKTYDACKLTQTEHRSAMEARAKEKGVALMTPRANACDNLKARGLIK